MAEPGDQAVQNAITAGITTVDFGAIAGTDPAADWTPRRVSGAQVRALFLKAIDAGQPCCLTGIRVAGPLGLDRVSGKVPLEADSCWFDGGIDLDGADLSSITIKASLVDRLPTGYALTARFAKLGGELDLKGSVLRGSAQLASITTSGGVGFEGGRITATQHVEDVVKPASFDDEWAINLTNAKLADLMLAGATITGGVGLPGATVSGQINLRQVTITKPHVRRVLWAQRAKVSESVLANNLPDSTGPQVATFGGLVDLHGAEIGGSVVLSNAVFNAPGPPDPSKPPPLVGLDLKFATVTSLLRLTGIELPDGGEVDLKGCTVAELDRAGPVWEQDDVDYDIEDLHYDAIDTTGSAGRDWIDGARSSLPGAFLTLAEAAAKRGESGDQTKAKIRASSAAASGPEKAFLGWIRYGYRPYFAAFPLLFLGLLCLLQVVHADDNAAAFAPVTVGDTTVTVDRCSDAEVRCLDPVLYAVDSVLPIDFDQVSTWRPNTEVESGNVLSWILTVNQAASWLLAGVFVAAVAGILNRA